MCVCVRVHVCVYVHVHVHVLWVCFVYVIHTHIVLMQVNCLWIIRRGDDGLSACLHNIRWEVLVAIHAVSLPSFACILTGHFATVVLLLGILAAETAGIYFTVERKTPAMFGIVCLIMNSLMVATATYIILEN